MKARATTWFDNADLNEIVKIVEEETGEKVIYASFSSSYDKKRFVKINFDGVPLMNAKKGINNNYIYLDAFSCLDKYVDNGDIFTNRNYNLTHTFGESFYKRYINYLYEINKGRKIAGKTFVEDLMSVPDQIEKEKQTILCFTRADAKKAKQQVAKELRAKLYSGPYRDKKLLDAYASIDRKAETKCIIRGAKFDELKLWVQDVLDNFLENEQGLEK